MCNPESSSEPRVAALTVDPGWRATLLVLTLLLTQIGLYVWMAPRGFEFTDESFYFLNYLYWRDLLGAMSLFGAYCEWPFRLLGQSVSSIRIFGLSLLLASSAFFVREMFSYVARHEAAANNTPWVFILAGMAASLFYFGYLTTLRAPSYNLLELCSMLVATGLFLRILRKTDHDARTSLIMFLYGVVIGAGGLVKATSGVLLLLIHAMFFVTVIVKWKFRLLLKFFFLAITGAVLNVVILQLEHPQWLQILREGVAMVNADGTHNLLGPFHTVMQAIRKANPILLALALGSFLIFSMSVLRIAQRPVPKQNVMSFPKIRRPTGNGAPSFTLFTDLHQFNRTVRSVLTAMLLGGFVLGLIWGPIRWWLPMAGVTVMMLWGIEILGRKPFFLTRGDLKDSSLLVLLFALPFAFSFGTNMSLLEHSELAAIFPLTAILLRLHRLARLGVTAMPALTFCLAALCIPTLVIQFRAATDVNFTYRQLSALGDQALPVTVGAADDRLLVDATTRDSLESLIFAARSAGFSNGQTILDFTGDGPGLIYAMGGRPLGSAWIGGGYPGSQAVAALIVEKLPVQVMRNAWLLSSDNNPRAIQGWEKLLDAQLGSGSHEIVASVDIRPSYNWWGKTPDRQSVHIWKPRE